MLCRGGRKHNGQIPLQKHAFGEQRRYVYMAELLLN